MFPNWTGWKTVKAILFVLGGLTGIVPAAYQALYSAIVGALGTIVVVLSGTNAGPAMARAAVKTLGLFTLVCLFAGCLSSAPVVPETPANQAQIQSCTNTATWHDGFVIGGMTVGIGGATVGTVSALASDSSTKNGLAITGAILAGAAAIGAAGGGLTAQNFANSHCTDVVGPLPAKRLVTWVPDPVPR